MPFDPYATGVLVKEHHDRLIANIDNYARDAGIQKHWIWTRLPDDVAGAEREYLVAIRRHIAEGTRAGLCYVGSADGIDDRFSAIAGLLVRNFIRARYMTVGTVLDGLGDGSLPDLSCVLIPNFFVPSAFGGGIAKWQVSALYDFLLDRKARGQQSIIYVADLNALGKEYGLPMKNLIQSSYEIVEA